MGFQLASMGNDNQLVFHLRIHLDWFVIDCDWKGIRNLLEKYGVGGWILVRILVIQNKSVLHVWEPNRYFKTV